MSEENKIHPGDVHTAFPIKITGYPIETGLTPRQYAAIHLGVPDSGQGWLDEMIRESRTEKLIEAALVGCSSHVNITKAIIAERTLGVVDELMEVW